MNCRHASSTPRSEPSRRADLKSESGARELFWFLATFGDGSLPGLRRRCLRYVHNTDAPHDVEQRSWHNPDIPGKSVQHADPGAFVRRQNTPGAVGYLSMQSWLL